MNRKQQDIIWLEKDHRSGNMKGFYQRLTKMARMEKEQKLVKGVLIGDPLDDGR